MINLIVRFFFLALSIVIPVTTSGCINKQKRVKSVNQHTCKNKVHVQEKVSSPSCPTLSIEERACTLCDKFVDIEHDKSLDWEHFAKDLATILKEKECYASASEALENLSSSTSPFYIGWKLRPHKKHFPKALQDKLNKFSSRQLIDIISTRVSTKKSQTC